MTVGTGEARISRHEDGIVVITYSKPPVNAMAVNDLIAIAEAFNSVGADRSTRVIILTGEGKNFCAGADLRAGKLTLDEFNAMHPRYQLDPGVSAREMGDAISHCQVPVIGAIHGAAIGGGLMMAGCCDVLVAQQDAYIQAGEINVGLLGAASYLQRMVGSFEARRLYYTGAPFGAADLQRVGAVHGVFEDRETLMAGAFELAREIASKSPIAIRLSKEVFGRLEMSELSEKYRMEQTYTARLGLFEDAGEASAARLERRPPNFNWR